ncbi:hypothetical protein Ais01nite_14080 [Asanoa ishikariensis]|uniref:hypothetical protein n=1 Tax=Asanoa ishikariensis TaxID=137265 RepID=UPI001951CFFE|nr:hypothetical protein [Asanoa ishikariensis]GIF63373.1 hypothetical protein Ais01nite_14080 [Asanoa ishikariensis]
MRTLNRATALVVVRATSVISSLPSLDPEGVVSGLDGDRAAGVHHSDVDALPGGSLTL